MNNGCHFIRTWQKSRPNLRASGTTTAYIMLAKTPSCYSGKLLIQPSRITQEKEGERKKKECGMCSLVFRRIDVRIL